MFGLLFLFVFVFWFVLYVIFGKCVGKCVFRKCVSKNVFSENVFFHFWDFPDFSAVAPAVAVAKTREFSLGERARARDLSIAVAPPCWPGFDVLKIEGVLGIWIATPAEAPTIRYNGAPSMAEQ